MEKMHVKKTQNCDLCGFVAEGETEAEARNKLIEHIKQVHRVMMK